MTLEVVHPSQGILAHLLQLSLSLSEEIVEKELHSLAFSLHQVCKDCPIMVFNLVEETQGNELVDLVYYSIGGDFPIWLSLDAEETRDSKSVRQKARAWLSSLDEVNQLIDLLVDQPPLILSKGLAKLPLQISNFFLNFLLIRGQFENLSSTAPKAFQRSQVIATHRPVEHVPGLWGKRFGEFGPNYPRGDVPVVLADPIHRRLHPFDEVVDFRNVLGSAYDVIDELHERSPKVPSLSPLSYFL